MDDIDLRILDESPEPPHPANVPFPAAVQVVTGHTGRFELLDDIVGSLDQVRAVVRNGRDRRPGRDRRAASPLRPLRVP